MKFNRYQQLIFCILFLSLPALNSCDTDEGNNSIDPWRDSLNGMLFIHSEDKDFPIIVYRNTGEVFGIGIENEEVSSVFYKGNKSENSVTIFLENDLPIKAVYNNLIVLFGNYTESSVDISIISSDNSKYLVRKVKTEIPIYTGGRIANVGDDDKRIRNLRIAAHSASLFGCAVGIASSFSPLAPIAIPLAAISCTTSIASLLNDLGVNDGLGAIEWISNQSEIVDLTLCSSTFLWVIDPLSAGTSCTALALNEMARDLEEKKNILNTNSNQIKLAFTEISSLVAYYPFNGNANDESGNGYHGVVNGATLFPDRKGNPISAYSFDGSDDFINLGTSSLLEFEVGDFAHFFWIRGESNTGTHDIYSSRNTEGSYGGNNFHIQFRALNDKLELDIQTTHLMSSEDILDNEWHFVGVVKGESSISIYVDGVLADTKSVSISDLPTSWGETWIGRSRNGAGYETYFKGVIDDIRIYNHVLTGEEILALYNL